MRPHSSSSSSMFSSTSPSYSFGSTSSFPTPSPHTDTDGLPSPAPLHPTLDPIYRPHPTSLLTPTPLASPSWLSHAQASLAGLSTDQEEARRQRVEARKRAMQEREEQPPARVRGSEPTPEVERAASPIILRPLPLSPPSPTPSLCSWRSTEEFPPAAARPLWPLSASPPPSMADEGEVEPGQSLHSLRGGEGVGAEGWSLRDDGGESARGVPFAGTGLSGHQRLRESSPHHLPATPPNLYEDGDRGDGRGAPSSEPIQRQHSTRPCPHAVLCTLSPLPLPAPSAGAHSSSPSIARSALQPTSFAAAAATAVSSSRSPTLRGFAGSPLLPHPLSSAILYVHSLVSTSSADAAGLRVRDLIVEIGPYSREKGWCVNMIEDVAHLIRSWPDLHSDQPLRVKVLRRIPLEQAQALPEVVWVRMKTNGDGDGNGQGRSAEEGGSGDGQGAAGEQVMALQPLLLQPIIGRWRLSDQQGGEGGGVLGAVLVRGTALITSTTPLFPPPCCTAPSSPTEYCCRCCPLQVNYPDPVPLNHPPSTAPSTSPPATIVRALQLSARDPTTRLAAPSHSAAAVKPAQQAYVPPRYTSSSYPHQSGSHLRGAAARLTPFGRPTLSLREADSGGAHLRRPPPLSPQRPFGLSAASPTSMPPSVTQARDGASHLRRL